MNDVRAAGVDYAFVKIGSEQAVALLEAGATSVFSGNDGLQILQVTSETSYRWNHGK